METAAAKSKRPLRQRNILLMFYLLSPVTFCRILKLDVELKDERWEYICALFSPLFSNCASCLDGGKPFADADSLSESPLTLRPTWFEMALSAADRPRENKLWATLAHSFSA